MSAVFAPEDLKVRGTEGLQFSDAYGLTCAQLGLGLEELLKINPDACFRLQDLIGYHFIQYGMDPDIIKETIDGVQGGMWKDWDRAQALRTALPKVLGEKTSNARVSRIRLGYLAKAELLLEQPSLSERLNVVKETDHAGYEVTSLYPKAGEELTYRGRTVMNVGSVVMRSIMTELVAYTDSLDIVSQKNNRVNYSIVAMSTNQGVPPPIRSMHLL